MRAATLRPPHPSCGPGGLGGRRLVALVLGILAPLGTFAVLAEDVTEGERATLDLALLRTLHAQTTGPLDALAVALSVVGGAAALVPLALAAAGALLARRRLREALYLCLALVGDALNPPLKALFARPRPVLWASPAPAEGYAFPSGHAMTSFLVLGALTLLAWPTRWRWWVLAGAGPLVAAGGLARVYLGGHYPSDVLGGWALLLGLPRSAGDGLSGVATPRSGRRLARLRSWLARTQAWSPRVLSAPPGGQRRRRPLRTAPRPWPISPPKPRRAGPTPTLPGSCRR